MGPGPYRSEIGALAFSADGKVLASLSNGSICLWDRGSGKLLREFGSAHFGMEPRLKFSADGKRLAAMGAPEHFWDVQRGTAIESRLPKADAGPEAVALSPDGKAYVVPKGWHLIKKRVPGDKVIGRYTQTKAILSNALYSRDGKIVFAGGYHDGQPVVIGWNEADDKIVFQIEGPPGQFDPRRLELSPDGKVLATGGESLRLWDIASADELLKLPKCRAFVISSDGKIICLTRHGVVLYNLSNGKEWARVAEPLHYPSSLAISPDGRTLALGHSKGFIRLVDLRLLSEAMPTTGHRGPVLGLAFAADGNWLVSASADSLRLWDGATGEEKRVLPGTTFGLNAVSAAPDGKTLAFGQDHVVQLMSTETWRPTERFVTAMSVDALAFSPDSKTLLTNIARIDLGKDKSYRTQIGNYPSVAFTADGGLVVKSGRLNRGPHLFRPDGDWIRFFDLHLHGGPVAVAPLGKSLAGAEPSIPNVVLFELASGEPRRWFTTRLPVEALAFSPDARVLAAGVGDAIVLWNMETAQEIIHFKGHAGLVTTLAFAPDGKTLASGGADSTVLLWDLEKKLPARQRQPDKISDEALEICWLELTEEDAAEAYRVMQRLICCGDQTVRHLSARMKLPAGLVHKPIPDHEAPPPAFLRWTRALEVLEFIGTPAARKLVAELSRGPDLSPITREARAAVARMDRAIK